VGWREFFTDPKLRAVIDQALADNRDLRAAVANIEIARAGYDIQRAQLLPTLNAQAGATFGREPQSVAGGPANAHGHVNVHEVTAGLGVSAYELDLFGRIRSLSKAAFEQYLASGQARRAVQISIVAQVAGDWLALGADRTALAVAVETQASAEKSLALTQARFGGGIASQLDVSQAETVAQQARFDVARLTAQAAQGQNALDLVVGAPVAETMTPQAVDEHAVLAQLPAGASSRVLLDRPDVLQAEDQLEAANADIGAARAAFFPTITLTGSGGLASAGLSTLFSAGSGAWSFAPQIVAPIFDAGRNRAGLASARATRALDQATYEKAIQTAFREVADALAQRGVIEAQLAAQRGLADAAGEALRLAEARYAAGIDTYLDVLIAQRTDYAARQTLVTTELAEATNLVTLYTALGGGLD
jgi:multidrug efflux system outer membrane protein